MCCYDWGSNHIVGYADDLALKIGDKDFKSVLKDSVRKKKGFEMMNLEMPKIIKIILIIFILMHLIII